MYVHSSDVKKANYLLSEENHMKSLEDV